LFGRGLKTLSLLTVALITGAFALVFFYAPNEADQGFIQKIFYLHVPLAIVALFGFVAGGIYGIRYLRSGDRMHDLRSYVAIHLSLILAVGALITGSIWARASWGVWWTWSSNQLVLFLVLFLFYCAYFMLRFSIEEGPRRERICAVYALFGVALIPVSFLAIRLASDFIHPTVFTRDGPQMTGTMFTAFLVCWAAIALLAYVMYRVELTGKRTDSNLRDLREALS
jgi:heme exporter protein C